jgi:hypothetical protein
LSIVDVKFAGSIVGEYLPLTGARVEADSDAGRVVVEVPEEPQPLAATTRNASPLTTAAVLGTARLSGSIICASR